MVTIVAHFRTRVVKFVFDGRNSGHNETTTQNGCRSNGLGPYATTLVARMRARQWLRLGSWITTSSETARMQAWPSNSIRSAE